MVFSRSSVAFTLFTLTGAGLSVAAQSISPGCQSVVLGISSDPAASVCLNAGGFLNLALQSTGNASLVQPFTDWATKLCTAGACTNETLASVVRNVTSACSTELRLDTSNTDEYIESVQKNYPTARKVICLKDTSANSLCINQELNTVERALGQPLTFSNLLRAAMNLELPSVSNVPSSELCSSCAKATYTTLKPAFPGHYNIDYEAIVKEQCGDDFINGEMPSSVELTAASGTVAPTPNGAMRLSTGVLGAVASTVLAVTAGFVFLA